ncbi:MAG: methanogenic corrinoid protein MtbC1 [Clostridium sp.]|jgi:methanogenic corrinoid protein MtbC1
MEDIKKYEDDFFKALLEGNRLECQKVMKEFRKSNLSIIVLYEEIFKKSLYRIGQMWESNKISVAVEHMATSITIFVRKAHSFRCGMDSIACV